MAFTPKILAFSGSLRKESYNQKLVTIAAEGARKAGAEVTVISLRDYPLPVFDEDLEKASFPENATKLKTLFLSHQALLIACPEYNSSVTAALKNAIDWVSRPVPGEAPLGCYTGKVAALLACSPGAFGGLRGLVTVRSILGNIKVTVLPTQIAIPKVNEKLNPEGSLNDAKIQESVLALAAELAKTTAKLHG